MMASAQASEAAAMSQQPIHFIETHPKVGQTISHEGKDYTAIKEGLAYILVPHGIPTSADPKLSKEDTQKQQVFYNPIQQFNRDLSVLAIKTFGEDLVHRRRQKHEQQRKKLDRKADKRGKQLQSDTNGHTQVEVPETGDQSSKKRTLQTEADVDVDEEVEARERDGQLSKKRKIQTDPIGIQQAGAHELAGQSEKKRKLQPDEDADGEGTREPNDQVPKKQRITADAADGAPTGGQAVSSSLGLPEGEALSLSGKLPAKPEWRPTFTILDALSATGLRALRYATEIPSSTSITANDMSSKATDSIALNIKYNKLEDKIQANTGNAIVHMYSFADKKGYDVIDLDPYGTAAPFIDAAIQAINYDGLLCVTCTDSAIFASHGYLEKTYSQYGGLPLKGEPCHEGGLRLLLHAIASSAARYGMAIEPLLSLSIDYYIRVFVRVRKSPADVKLLAGKTMIVYHCQNGCGSWSTQFLARNKAKENRDGTSSYRHSFAQGPSTNQLCEHCGSKTHLSGPMYGGQLHNVGFIERVLAQLDEVEQETYPTKDRIEGMLHTALEEITFGATVKEMFKNPQPKQLDPLIPKADPAVVDHHPFFFIPSAVARVIHCQAPSLAAVRGALRKAGFEVTMSHCKPGSIRTTAPWTAVWHVMLEWVRQKAPLKNRLKIGSAGYAIMAKGSAHEVDDSGGQDAEGTTANGEDPESSSSRTTSENKDTEGQEASKTGGSKDAPPSYLGTNFEVIFDEALGRDHDRGKYVRYQLAPRENWGPMSRAK